jgi:hypothetical protein
MNPNTLNLVERTRQSVTAWAMRVKQTWMEAKTPRERVRRLWADKTNRVIAVVLGVLLLGVLSSNSGSGSNGTGAGYGPGAGAGEHVNPNGAWSESYSNGRVTHSEYSGVTVYGDN